MASKLQSFQTLIFEALSLIIVTLYLGQYCHEAINLYSAGMTWLATRFLYSDTFYYHILSLSYMSPVEYYQQRAHGFQGQRQ